jgi:hypothetical protein
MIPLIDRASRRDFNGGVVEISVIFRHDGPFFITRGLPRIAVVIADCMSPRIYRRSIELVKTIPIPTVSLSLRLTLIFHLPPNGGKQTHFRKISEKFPNFGFVYVLSTLPW